ncbi:restriction endonuclease [bacterium]|nr:restriction endonuclease [bacterium]
MTTSKYIEAIRNSNLSIYDPIEVGDPELWVPSKDLELILNQELRGESLAGLPLRTRSKVVKTKVCEALGYTPPQSFRKTQPRFLGQNFDVYAQKSNNLQIWNEELIPSRRYVLIRVGEDNVISSVKVVTGDTLAELDTTGTLTKKYQARITLGSTDRELISEFDTANLLPIIATSPLPDMFLGSPTRYPNIGQLLPIRDIFERLQNLIGQIFADPGVVQERNRGGATHRLACDALGYSMYHDDGGFPDVTHQLLEVKLQTSPTIDLGIALPNSSEPLDYPSISSVQVRHRDVRYAIFYAETDGYNVRLTHLLVTNGADFFSRFPQFGGREINGKLQIPLPGGFFH